MAQTNAVQTTKVTVEENRILVRSQFKFKDVCKSIEGARWSPKHKAWAYPASPVIAETIVNEFDDLEMDEGFEQLFAGAQKRKDALSLKSAEELPPVPVSKLDAWLHQRQAFWFAMNTNACLLDMWMGEQPLDEPVLTPSGWRTMGELKVGDHVMGSDGLPTEVLNIYEFESRPLWNVKLADGSSTRCSPTHLWTVKTQCGGWKEVTTITVKDSLKESKWKKLDKLPRMAPVSFPTAKLPLDPYVLGFLLADGSFTRNLLKFTTSQHRVVKEIVSRGYEVKTDADGIHHIIKGENPSSLLRVLGLNKTGSSTKKIPRAYLQSSIEQRMDLLQGMMDGDGRTTRNDTSLYYSTTSEQLAQDFSELVRSLGGKGSVQDTGHRCSGNVEWRISLGLPKGIKPFGVSGKAYAPQRNPHRRIVEVEDTGESVPMRCIKVANEDELYVTKDYILTHNTGKSKIAVDLVVNREAKLTLVVCPSSVVNVWPKEFGIHAGREVRVLPLRKGSVKKRAEQAEQAIRQSKATNTPLVLVINYESVWREAFSKMISKQDIDMMILDESHRIKSPGGKASTFCARLGRRANYRLCLTGTPTPHSPLDVYSQYRFLDPGIFGTSFARFRQRYAIMGGYGGYEIKGYQNTGEYESKFRSIAYNAGKDVLDLPEAVHTTRTFELGSKTRKLYQSLEKSLWAEIESGEITVTNALTKLLRLQQLTGGAVTDDEGNTTIVGTEKRDLLKDILQDLDPEEPVVVFARFRHDLDMIREVVESLPGKDEDSKRRYGELSGRQSDLTDRATMPENVDVLGVQIQSGGVGIDLTRARYAIYYSLGFSLGDYEQSQARIHRPGQDRSCVYMHLVAEGSVDEKVYGSLRARRKVIDDILNRG